MFHLWNLGEEKSAWSIKMHAPEQNIQLMMIVACPLLCGKPQCYWIHWVCIFQNKQLHQLWIILGSLSVPSNTFHTLQINLSVPSNTFHTLQINLSVPSNTLHTLQISLSVPLNTFDTLQISRFTLKYLGHFLLNFLLCLHKTEWFDYC